MNYHIVRTNDKLETIINLYNLSPNELIDLNRHISDWNKLIPGTRIKLPVIPDALTEELNDIEPFIEDYYPKIDLKRFESTDDDVISNDYNQETVEEENIFNKEEENIENGEKIKNSNFTSSIKLPYSYYYDPYNYYRYHKRKTK